MRVTAAMFDSRIGGFVRMELVHSFHKDEGASIELFPLPFTDKDQFEIGAEYILRLEKVGGKSE